MNNSYSTTSATTRRHDAPREHNGHFVHVLSAVLFIAMSGTIVACGQTDSATTDGATERRTTTGGFRVTDEQRARLSVMTVEPISFRPRLDVTGTVSFNGDISTQVISQISGPVTRIVAKLGAAVAPGDLLAMVTSPDFAAAVSDFRKADAEWRNAKRILDRNEQLFANDALARTDLDQSKTDAAAAAADRDAAEQLLRSIGIDSATTAAIRDGKVTGPIEAAIRAPIAGTVVEQLITPGQLMEAGVTPAFTVADLSSMWVMASVYGSDVGAIRIGDAADIVTDQQRNPLHGRVDFIAPIVDPGTRATTVRILVQNVGHVLKRDEFVQIHLHATRERTGLVLPASAVLRDDDNLPFVYIANADTSFSRRRITLGAAVDGGYEISDGLTKGDKVLTDGALFVQFAEHQ